MAVSSDENMTERPRSETAATKRTHRTVDLPSLSVVCAVVDEEEAVTELLDRLARVLADLDLTFEIIIVDDGSKDTTAARVKEAIARIAGLRLVQLYRNYGQVVALGAGMTFARGN